MKSLPKIVTVVTLLTLLGVTLGACTSDRRSVTRGTSDLSEMKRIEAELATAFGLHVSSPEHATRPVAAFAEEYQWQRLDDDELARVRELLSREVDLTEDLLAIDARKGVALLHRDRVEAQSAAARAYLKTLETHLSNRKPGYQPTPEARRSPAYRRELAI